MTNEEYEILPMHTLPKVCGLTLEELAQLYAKYRSVPRLAKHLNFSTRTTSKWLRIAGVKTLGHRPHQDLHPTQQTEFSALKKWEEAHPGKRLPLKLRDAAQEVGCTVTALRSTLQRRRSRAIKYLESLGALQQYDIVFHTTDGRRVRSRYFTTYRYGMKLTSTEVTLYIRVKDLELQALLPYNKLLHEISIAQRET